MTWKRPRPSYPDPMQHPKPAGSTCQCVRLAQQHFLSWTQTLTLHFQIVGGPLTASELAIGPAVLLAVVFLLDLWGPHTKRKSDIRAIVESCQSHEPVGRLVNVDDTLGWVSGQLGWQIFAEWMSGQSCKADWDAMTVSELTVHGAPTDHSPSLGDKPLPPSPPLSDSNYSSHLRPYLITVRTEAIGAELTLYQSSWMRDWDVRWSWQGWVALAWFPGRSVCLGSDKAGLRCRASV